MWGIRAIRAIWLAAVVLAAVGGGGCRHDGGVVDEKRMKELLYESFQSGPPGVAQPGDKNAAPAENGGTPQKGGARLTPERIHGGII